MLTKTNDTANVTAKIKKICQPNDCKPQQKSSNDIFCKNAIIHIVTSMLLFFNFLSGKQSLGAHIRPFRIPGRIFFMLFLLKEKPRVGK